MKGFSMCYQRVNGGPSALLDFARLITPGGVIYQGSAAFHPGRVTRCWGQLTFPIYHPSLGEKVGQLDFTTGSHESVIVGGWLFDRQISGMLTRTKPSRFNPTGTVLIGREDLDGPSFSPTVPSVHFRACMDYIDPEVRRIFRKRPSIVRFSVQFPEICPEFKSAIAA